MSTGFENDTTLGFGNNTWVPGDPPDKTEDDWHKHITEPDWTVDQVGSGVADPVDDYITGINAGLPAGVAIAQALSTHQEAEPRFLPHADTGTWSKTRPETANGHNPANSQATTGAASSSQNLDDDQAFREYVDRKKFSIRVASTAQREVRMEENPPAPLPEFLTLRERLQIPVTAVRYRIDRLQPTEARIVLAAQFKSGKTTLVGNLIRALADGTPFLGRYDVHPLDGNIGLIDFEMSGRQLDLWLADQGIRNDDRIIVLPLRGSASSFNILDEQVRREWAARIRARGIKYLIWDCFRPVVDALGLEEKTAGHLLTAFDELLKLADCQEAVVVHHMGHSGERSRGDSRLRDWPDVEWTLVREDEDPASKRFFKAFGRDVDEKEAALAYNAETRHLSIAGGAAGGSRKDAKVNSAMEAVLNLITTSPGTSGRGIEALLKDSDHGRDVIRKAVRKARIDGLLTTKPGEKGAFLYYPVEPPEDHSARVRE